LQPVVSRNSARQQQQEIRSIRKSSRYEAL
jgi:hypothetical protein